MRVFLYALGTQEQRCVLPKFKGELIISGVDRTNNMQVQKGVEEWEIEEKGMSKSKGERTGHQIALHSV